MTHTKGPWKVADYGTDRGGFAIEGADDEFLFFSESHANKADAYLIAAAPDLLAACKLALNAFETNSAIDWDELSEAISKAEGLP